MYSIKLLLVFLLASLGGIRAANAEVSIPAEYSLDLGIEFEFIFYGEGMGILGLNAPPALIEFKEDQDLKSPPNSRSLYEAKISGRDYSNLDGVPKYLSIMRLDHDLFLIQASTDFSACRNDNGICYLPVFQILPDKSIVWKRIECDSSQNLAIANLFPGSTCSDLGDVKPNTGRLNFSEYACAVNVLARLAAGRVVGRVVSNMSLEELPVAKDFCEEVYNNQKDTSRYTLIFRRAGVSVSAQEKPEKEYLLFPGGRKFNFRQIYQRLLEDEESPFYQNSTIEVKFDLGMDEYRTLTLLGPKRNKVLSLNLNDDLQEYWVTSASDFIVENGLKKGQKISEKMAEISNCEMDEHSLLCRSSAQSSVVYNTGIVATCSASVADEVYINRDWRRHSECIYVTEVIWSP